MSIEYIRDFLVVLDSGLTVLLLQHLKNIVPLFCGLHGF